MQCDLSQAAGARATAPANFAVHSFVGALQAQAGVSLNRPRLLSSFDRRDGEDYGGR